uniref:Uncharacterized protein n=1 Tax=Arundo donax TaxID=35708 RepID=A0A0A8Z3B0_ARUDO
MVGRRVERRKMRCCWRNSSKNRRRIAGRSSKRSASGEREERPHHFGHIKHSCIFSYHQEYAFYLACLRI